MGVGAGQMNRVNSARIAVEKARRRRARARSARRDAFMPFPDSLEVVRRGRRDRRHPAGRLDARRGGHRRRPTSSAWRWSSPGTATSATREGLRRSSQATDLGARPSPETKAPMACRSAVERCPLSSSERRLAGHRRSSRSSRRGLRTSRFRLRCASTCWRARRACGPSGSTPCAATQGRRGEELAALRGRNRLHRTSGASHAHPRDGSRDPSSRSNATSPTSCTCRRSTS